MSSHRYFSDVIDKLDDDNTKLQNKIHDLEEEIDSFWRFFYDEVLEWFNGKIDDAEFKKDIERFRQRNSFERE